MENTPEEPTPAQLAARRRWSLIVGVGLLVLGLAAGATWLVRQQWGQPAADADLGPADVLARGRVVYQSQCAVCHGSEGHGDGPSAAGQRPPPRDFAAGDWKFGATPAAVRRVTAEGVPGTAMPAFGQALSATDLDAVTRFVQTLGPRRSATPQLPAASALALKRAGFVPADAWLAAPALDLRDAATGKALVPADLRGKAVLLNFWGTGCVHCLKAFPQLEELARRFAGRGLVVVCVCADEVEAAVVEGVARRHVQELAVFVDPRGLTRLRYDVHSLPTACLIDAEGRLLGRAEGALDWAGEGMSAALAAVGDARDTAR